MTMMMTSRTVVPRQLLKAYERIFAGPTTGNRTLALGVIHPWVYTRLPRSSLGFEILGSQDTRGI